MRHARSALAEMDYDSASFFAEQASQLFLKTRMLDEVGEIPRVHGVRELLGMLAGSTPERGRAIRSFSRRNREELRLLDDAYISARYLPTAYTKEEAAALVRLARQIRRLVAGSKT